MRTVVAPARRLDRGKLRAVALTGLLACCARAPADDTPSLDGFSAAGAAAELKLEQRFDAGLSAAELRAWMQQLSSAPNHVGSPHDKANAEFELQKFREWGWDATIETFSVLYPTPREELVELVSPTHFTALLTEPAVPGDSVAAKMQQQLPAYNTYGGDGDVTAELVYVNQGMPDDYAELERQGISVKGRIVLTRYGGGWRGLKPKLAYEHGAVGCLIYSDPHEDGYAEGEPYPLGGYRPRDGIQRGSVQDSTLYPGDPLTPGVASTATAKRLSLGEAKTILKIPVLPISAAAAEPLLAALGGGVAPAGWRGSLPLTYHEGPGPARVHLKVLSDWSQKTIYDVIAKIRGAQQPERWIMRGNHRDAWVFGAMDPLSGQVALMAEAKAIGGLLQGRWRPRRTLVYASWDGEEPGLLGSTEWAELHAAELHKRAALYINSDMNGRGILSVGGGRSLQRFASEAARDVADPEIGSSVLARAAARQAVRGYEAGALVPGNVELAMSPLGSGSDYVPFLHHLGIRSLDVGFGGEGEYGVYHSAYDTFDHYQHFVDPSFEYGVTLARLVGRMVLRAAQGDLLPSHESDFAASIEQYDDELHKLLEAMRSKSLESAKLLDADAYRLAEDPLRPRAPPPRAATVPALNFAELDRAAARLEESARAFDSDYARIAAGGAADAAARERLNAALTLLERALLDAKGLPGRGWYQNMVYAPGVYTGYGAKTLPGIREAIEARRWDEALQQVGAAAHALDAYSAALERAISSRLP